MLFVLIYFDNAIYECFEIIWINDVLIILYCYCNGLEIDGFYVVDLFFFICSWRFWLNCDAALFDNFYLIFYGKCYFIYYFIF